MNTTRRRTFLKMAGFGTAALALKPGWAGAEGRKIVVGVIGTGGMGSAHVRSLAQRKDAEVAYVCDVDQNRLGAAAQAVTAAAGKAPKTVKDLRQILDDAAVDAVFIATPDHWHAPASILALNAGKHVYVEKPCCHNISARAGRTLCFDPAAEKIVGDAEAAPLVRRAYRDGHWAVPRGA